MVRRRHRGARRGSMEVVKGRGWRKTPTELLQHGAAAAGSLTARARRRSTSPRPTPKGPAPSSSAGRTTAGTTRPSSCRPANIAGSLVPVDFSKTDRFVAPVRHWVRACPSRCATAWHGTTTSAVPCSACSPGRCMRSSPGGCRCRPRVPRLVLRGRHLPRTHRLLLVLDGTVKRIQESIAGVRPAARLPTSQARSDDRILAAARSSTAGPRPAEE
jgi:hypothetical protein